MKSIAIVGGGAGGFFSAICMAQKATELGLHLDIRIFESSGQYLKKVKISGGGRCNVTHNCFDVRTFCQNYPRGSKELLSPMQRFQAQDTVSWFLKQGIELHAEEDGRMFPVTNDSSTIIDCYLNLVEKFGIKLLPYHGAKEIIKKEDGKWEIGFKEKEAFCADALLIATGSSEGGYLLAQSVGHTITERAPSLFSFKIQDPLIEDLQGLSFPDTQLKLTLPDKKIFKQKGPTLITHWGLSGPAILKLSAWAAREMKKAKYEALLTVNWFGTKTLGQVESDLETLKNENGKSFIKNVYPTQLPKRFWLSLLNKNLIPQEKQWANLSKKEMNLILMALTESEFKILGQNRFKDEFVECGGVSLKEVDFKTMESKIQSDLYFSGEILDIDGITGGFNFQNAWTTGWITAQSVVQKIFTSL